MDITEAARQSFLAASQRLRESRGGRPTAELVNGDIVFTYPDGTKTIGGVVQPK